MAIASMDQLVAGFNNVPYPNDVQKDPGTAKGAGIWHSAWYLTGTPGAGAAPGGGLSGATRSGTVVGQIPSPLAVAGQRSYLARLELTQTGNVGCVAVYDRLWDNSAIVVTTTTGQTINSVAWPARDQSASTNGAGVFVALEVNTVTGGAAVTNTTLTYTNSAGTASRTATMASFPAAAPQGTWVPFSLQAGDSGVRSIQTLTLGTSYVSGTINLVAYRLVARLSTPTANIGFDRSFSGLALPVVWDNSVLWPVYLPSGTALGSVYGSLSFAQG